MGTNWQPFKTRQSSKESNGEVVHQNEEVRAPVKEETTKGVAPPGYMGEFLASAKMISMAILANSCAGSPGRHMESAAKQSCDGAKALWAEWERRGWTKGTKQDV
jgi:hypothetical protein